MLIHFEWLKELIEIKESPEEIAEILTMVGLETVLLKNDILEIEVTPNRADCLSLIGIAREIGAITKRKIKFPKIKIDNEFNTDFKVKINSLLCKRYTGRVIKGVKVGESPKWLKRRLETSGIRSINNVVDITNYVLLELGHPLHAFDLNTLKGNMIKIDISGKIRRFKTIDGVERELCPDALLIWDSEKPIAIAGIMGGIETEVTENTTDLFIESAYFEPYSIRKTSSLLGLKTEASYRFERGTDIDGLVTALDRASYLIKQICKGELSKRIEVYPIKHIPPKINLRYHTIKRILGENIDKREVQKILKYLGFEINTQESDVVTLKPPAFRIDITQEADLIEEVARLYGYHKIKSKLPNAIIRPERISILDKVLKRLKDILVLSGFSEAINYSFMNPQNLDKLRIYDNDIRRKTVSILNPLKKEESILRTFLLSSLIECLVLNINRKVEDVKLFEISKVFINNKKDKLPHEKYHLAAIYFYKKGQRLWEDNIEVYYLMKGIFEKIVESLKLKKLSYKKTSEPFAHPGRTSDIYIEDKKIGYVGVLSPEIKESFGIIEIKEDIGILEIEIDELLKFSSEKIVYKPLPRFPYVQRDISLIVEKSMMINDILEPLYNYPSELIEDIKLFDVFEGKNIPKGMKSVGISIIYRSKDRTLTENEVNKLHEEIVKYLLKKTGGKLRI